MRLRLALALLLAAPAALAHAGPITVDFEDLSIPASPGYVDNPAGFHADPGKPLPQSFTSTFSSHGAAFNNTYTVDNGFSYWSGWAYSKVNISGAAADPAQPDYTYQYAAATGTDASGHGNYGIAFDGAPNASYINLPGGATPVSMLVTNTTYAYLSMLNGDGFAKQFTTGDFFKLTVTGYDKLGASGSSVGTTSFFLANYTSPSDKPVDVWSKVDLSSLVGAKSLGFALTSSDNGMFGMNTPAYFAMDNLVVTPASVPEPASLALVGIGATGLALAGLRRKARA